MPSLASLLLMGPVLSSAAHGEPRSASASLTADRAFSGASTLLSISLPQGGPTLILADGWLTPRGEQRADIHLAIDGRPAGSEAVLDWHGAHYPVTHGFRVLAAPYLPPGPHRITLEAASDAPAVAGAGTSLSVLAEPAAEIRQQMANTQAGIVQPDVAGGLTDADKLPHTIFASVTPHAALGLVVAFAAGSVRYEGDGRKNFGDALWGLWLGDAEAEANSASYADNDICRCAELTAPLAVQGLFTHGAVGTIGVGATAEPWGAGTGTNQVRYRVLPHSALVVLAGGMQVAGGLQVLDAAHGAGAVKRFPYLCTGSAHGFSGCNAAGTPRIIGEGTLDVPAGHTRAILFSAALRIQGASHDHGGRFELWLELDGKHAGPTAIQDLAPKSSVSTRTVTLSYLATGGSALAPGRHHVALVARAAGDFEHLAVTRNLPLVWLD